MIPNKIIETAVIVACMAAASGRLPQLVKAMDCGRKAGV